MRRAMRVGHYSPNTEACYIEWVERFIRFHGLRHPNGMGAAEIEMFLSDLAVRGHVAASTQSQAFNALLFLYRQVLELELPQLDAARARRPVCWISIPPQIDVAASPEILGTRWDPAELQL